VSRPGPVEAGRLTVIIRVVDTVAYRCVQRNWKGVDRQSAKTDSEGRLRRLGSAIRTARLARGVSQEALADAAGIDRSHMGKIERGERNVSLLNIAKIGDALGTTIASLMVDAGI